MGGLRPVIPAQPTAYDLHQGIVQDCIGDRSLWSETPRGAAPCRTVYRTDRGSGRSARSPRAPSSHSEMSCCAAGRSPLETTSVSLSARQSTVCARRSPTRGRGPHAMSLDGGSVGRQRGMGWCTVTSIAFDEVLPVQILAPMRVHHAERLR